ncbi:MBL fold metallo-hydrolase RNA specificity domain-containing protein [Acidaminobacterium chupaoyuni]
MKITFIGAAHEVTGSCVFLENAGHSILIDYGMEQGSDLFENASLPVPASEIEYILLTHSHIDHSGMLPALYAAGFRGEIHATQATCALCDIMLRDSAHIQEFEAEWKNRKAQRAGRPLTEPLYTMKDAEGVLELFHPHPYDQMIPICNGLEACFRDAGHLLGSASIEAWLSEGSAIKKIVFSGDIGNTDQPLIKDPTLLKDADFVVMESTYGDRTHGPRPNYIEDLTKIIQRTFDRGGSVVIPSFAVGRTQELLYFIRKIKEAHLLKGHEGFPVYVDSPLANEATTIYMNYIDACFDEEAKELVRQGINPLQFENLTMTLTSEDSKLINEDTRPKIILSASGMCDAGRIRHHLKHHLWRAEDTILFVGYQSEGTLGRLLYDGAERVKLFGEEIDVCAEITALAGISGHADKNGLERWITGFTPAPKMVFVVHGQDQVTDIFARRLLELKIRAQAPYSGSRYDLAEEKWEFEAQPAPVTKVSHEQKKALSPAYIRLTEALKNLTELVAASTGRANKDLARLANRINDLCDWWK